MKHRRLYKKAMTAAAKALSVEVPPSFAHNDRWGSGAKTLAAALQQRLGLPVNGRLSGPLKKALRPYLPRRYRYLGREVWLAAGHAGNYNRMAYLPTKWESKETVLVVNELARECLRRGAKRVYVVPHALDLGASIEYVRRRASKGAFCWELHYNAGPASVRGWVTAYSAGDRRSLRMARTLAKEVRQTGFPLWAGGIIASSTIGRWNGWTDIGWHRSLKAAGLVPNLLEMGFGTSPKDGYWWSRKKRRAALVAAMADALFPPYPIRK